MRQTRWLATLALTTLAVPGYSAPPAAHNNTTTLRVESNLVLVPAKVVDQHERFVEGLTKGDFRLLANGREQSIVSLSLEQTPISVAIVFDASASMNNVMSAAKRAVHDFVAESDGRDEFFLITVGDRPGFKLQFEDRVGEVLQVVRNEQAHGSTALLDSIYLAANTLKRANHARRAILVISDGEDNNSRYSNREVLRMLRESDLTLYALGLGVHRAGPEEAPRESGGDLLNLMALDTGGRYFEIEDTSDVADVVRHLDLRSQYVLGFWPSPVPLDGKYHRIQLKLVNRNGSTRKLRVYWRPGYFAPEGAVTVSDLGNSAPSNGALANGATTSPRKNIRF